MRLDNLIIYRATIFIGLIDYLPRLFVASQAESNFRILIHLKNRKPGRVDGEDNLCSCSRVNCAIGNPVRLYFL